MFRLLSWLVAVPVGVLGLVFALSNKDDVTLRFWPFDLQVVLPLSILVLGIILVGVSTGLFLGWMNSLAVRIELRKVRKAFLKLQEDTRIIPPSPQNDPLPPELTHPPSRSEFMGRVRLFSLHKPKF